jgi:hypothetical protein
MRLIHYSVQPQTRDVFNRTTGSVTGVFLENIIGEFLIYVDESDEVMNGELRLGSVLEIQNDYWLVRDIAQPYSRDYSGCELNITAHRLPSNVPHEHVLKVEYGPPRNPNIQIVSSPGNYNNPSTGARPRRATNTADVEKTSSTAAKPREPHTFIKPRKLAV